ncbi:MAG: hypothetical protein QXZ14_11355 [Candidatus Jordarchaeales archaeon]|nr:hypothetical protein [Candidatus Jordarchaeia archaeon]
MVLILEVPRFPGARSRYATPRRPNTLRSNQRNTPGTLTIEAPKREAWEDIKALQDNFNKLYEEQVRLRGTLEACLLGLMLWRGMLLS